MTYAVGDRIRFDGERNGYTVRACDDRYLVCTKPFNCRGTTLYTIVDLQEKVRGRENLIFGAGFDTDAQCVDALIRVSSGLTEISSRHRVPLELCGLKKAYVAHDGDEQWSVIFAEHGVVARRQAAEEFDCGFSEVDLCRREPTLDRYGSANDIPIAAMLGLGWWTECHGCGRRMSYDDDADYDAPREGLDPVGTWGGKCFCTPRCRDETAESDLIAHDAGLLAIGALETVIRTKFPAAAIAAVHADANGHGHVRQAFVEFSFPGSVHGSARLDRHRGLTVCAGDYDAWRRYCEEAWAYPELPRLMAWAYLDAPQQKNLTGVSSHD